MRALERKGARRMRTAEMRTFPVIASFCIFHNPYPILPPLTGEGAEGGWGQREKYEKCNTTKMFILYAKFANSPHAYRHECLSDSSDG